MHGLRPRMTTVAAFVAQLWLTQRVESAAIPSAPAALAAEPPPRPVALLRSETSGGSRAAHSNSSNGILNASSSTPPAAPTVGALLQVTGQVAEGSTRSRFLSVVEDVDEVADGAESRGSAGSVGTRDSSASAAMETITLTTTTTEFWEPTTQAAPGSAFIQVTPDVKPGEEKGSTSNNAMRCKGQYVMDFPGATTQWKCEALATVPPASTNLKNEDVRYYQFCAKCPPPRCQLVQWCLEVDTNPGLEWRVYRNAAVAPDMWYMAAGHTMCSLPESFFDTTPVNPGVRPDGPRGVQHQLACQEYAAKENKPFYQFCSSCTAGEKCTIVDTCDRCISMDVTDWHVFKAERAGPPCSTAR